MQGKMAIIGDGDSVLIFSAVGIDPYPVQDSTDAAELIKKLAKNYKIIFITDVIAKDNDETIKKYLTSPYPVIISVPSKSGSNGYGESLIKEAMEKALGIDILFNKNDEEEGH